MTPRHHLDRCLYCLRLTRPRLTDLSAQWAELPADSRRAVARTAGMSVMDIQTACGGAWEPTYPQTRTVLHAMTRAWLEVLLRERSDCGGVS